MELTALTIGEGWLQAMERVLDRGHLCVDGPTDTVLELLPLIIHITSPVWPDSIIEKYGSQEGIDWMTKNFFDETPVLDWGYSYAQRIRSGGGGDQIKAVTKKLKQRPNCKSAIVALMGSNEVSRHLPCLSAIDFKLRNDTLHLSCFFRSQDIASKMYADAYCIHRLGIEVAQELSCKFIQMHSMIASAHIYERDIEKAKDILSKEASHK
jgi:thymidylate synthase